jgi:O-antigen/teichoic acid export membrane protein
MSNTKTIARNTSWYGLETVISSVVTLITSVAIARTLGPSKMAIIIFIAYLASVVSTLGALGIPATTQKYMAEFLGMGDRGTARHIFIQTLLLQIGLATLATIGIVYWVVGHASAGEELASVLVALSIWPQMINSVPAQANVAMEEMSRNLPASVISILVFFFSIAATLVFKWGIVGVGASMLLTRTIDFLIRLVPTLKHILSWEKAHVQPPGLRERMISFSWQSVTSMVVAMVVWDRSEFFLLKHLCKADIRQIAFYSVAFSMAERLLITAAVFGSASGATIYAQYGRDKSKLASITASSFRYLALSSIPVHFIAAALAFPALLLLYGHQYQDAAMVVTLAPLLCMPKAFVGPVQYLLQSAERQSYVIFATVVAGVLDIGVAWYLIPRHGAVGACIGSGVAQVTAVGMMWAIGIRLYRVKLPWLQVGKIAFSSLVAALTAHYIAVRLAPLWAVLVGGSVSLMVLLGLFYLLRVLEPEDHDRFNILTGMLPKPLAGPADKIVSILIRPGFAGATPTNV